MKIVNKLLPILYFILFMLSTINACKKPYEVKKGDTCYNIALANGITLAKLEELSPGNRCGPLLQPGDKLCLQ
jgi:LysM repeat protein